MHHTESWVVYTLTLGGKHRAGQGPCSAVCEQAEWDEMERADPGRYVLVKQGLTSEGEAERLARGSSGDQPARKSPLRS